MFAKFMKRIGAVNSKTKITGNADKKTGRVKDFAELDCCLAKAIMRVEGSVTLMP